MFEKGSVELAETQLFFLYAVNNASNLLANELKKTTTKNTKTFMILKLIRSFVINSLHAG